MPGPADELSEKQLLIFNFVLENRISQRFSRRDLKPLGLTAKDLTYTLDRLFVKGYLDYIDRGLYRIRKFGAFSNS